MTTALETPTDPFLTEAYRIDPRETAVALRDEEPVHYIAPVDAWVVLRHDDCKQLLKDPRVTNDRRAWSRYVAPPEGSQSRWFSEHSFFSAPEDEHARLRRLVSASLTPRGVKRMAGQIDAVIEQFAEKLRGRRGVVDVAAEFTSVVPNTVISRITGIPPKENDEARFRQLARDTLSGINPFIDAAGRQIAEDAMNELAAWIRELAEERRRHPQEDMISDLLLANEEGGATTVDEIIVVILGLVTAGTETTSVATHHAIELLLNRPGALADLRAHPEIMPSAVRELIRYAAGFHTLPRYACEDFEFRGHSIRKGQIVLLHLSGAHRDPAAYPDPDRLDLRREGGDLIMFGNGPHYCIGANLAQLEMQSLLRAALAFLPEGARVVEEKRVYAESLMGRRPENLPIDFG